ncbi:MAG: polysaccharide deacetylase family protein [Gammaproteobacteria bacterium]|jgi:peptidoglycan/xylan/chitin deacetylase (PgdA/CDA1 family)
MDSISRRGFGRKFAGLAATTLTAPLALAQAGGAIPAEEASAPTRKKGAGKEIICAFGTDIDSVAGQIGSYAGGDSPSDIQRGIFAGEVGTIRLLKLFKKYELKTSFFIPAHSIETFPEPMKRVADEGHEIGAHGYLHENPIAMTPEQEEAVLVKSIEVIEKLCGQKPRGYVAPWWEMSASTAALLQKYGFQYDHSQGYRDFQPFYARVGDSWNVIDYAKKAEEWMKPLTHGKEIDLVEIGANWYLDDLPPMMFMKKVPNSHGFVNPRDIEQMWRDQFDWVYREMDYAVFPFTIHPGVSGRPQVILMLERLIEYMNGHVGVKWMTFEEIAADFRQRFPFASGERPDVI